IFFSKKTTHCGIHNRPLDYHPAIAVSYPSLAEPLTSALSAPSLKIWLGGIVGDHSCNVKPANSLSFKVFLTEGLLNAGSPPPHSAEHTSKWTNTTFSYYRLNLQFSIELYLQYLCTINLIFSRGLNSLSYKCFQ